MVFWGLFGVPAALQVPLVSVLSAHTNPASSILFQRKSSVLPEDKNLKSKRETVEKLNEKGTPRKWCRGDSAAAIQGVPVVNSVPMLPLTSAVRLWLCCLPSFMLTAMIGC